MEIKKVGENPEVMIVSPSNMQLIHSKLGEESLYPQASANCTHTTPGETQNPGLSYQNQFGPSQRFQLAQSVHFVTCWNLDL